MILSGENDYQLVKSINKVVAYWGGEFSVRYVDSWRRFLNEWRSTGKTVHLTMYGADARQVVDEIRSCNKDLLVIVGSQKVPKELYQIADWNVSVTNQPHSEVSALAVFLHLLRKGDEFDLDFQKARIRVVPTLRGKTVARSESSRPSS
jgi:tRNA (cytidine56-2'-O)-methyltransferase